MAKEDFVLVSGGAGYIGAHAVKELQQSGRKVIVLDNLVYGHREIAEKVLKAKLVVADTADHAAVEKVFKSNPIGSVMHFAAYTYVGESVQNPSKYYLNNVSGTLSLLDAMVNAGVKKFVFSSTCATYGPPVAVPISETHPQNPINPYGSSKLMVERILADFAVAYGVRYVSFRYFNAAGADPSGLLGEDHTPESHLIPLVLDAAQGKRDAIQIFGTDYPTPDGTCIRDYIHVTDLARAHVMGLEYLEKGGKSDAFNLGTGRGFSVREIIETAKRVTGKPIKTVEQGRREGDPPRLVADSAKAQKILGWTPQYPDPEVIIAHAWKWHQKLKR